MKSKHDLTQLIFERKSIRKFSDRQVPASCLDQILSAAIRAPTGGNLQNYSVIVTEDKQKILDLGSIHFDQEMFRTAPMVLTFCVDVARNENWFRHQGSEPGFQNLWGFYNF